MKILNLYCGIGGNRELWGEEHDITAIEIDEKIAEVYKSRFNNDTVIVGDALEYLLSSYRNFDFIWASPPCQSHSRIINSQYTRESYKAKFPDMTLYQIILFLQGHCRDKKWVVENVIPYYDYLISPTVILDRHSYWSNFSIPESIFDKEYIIKYVTKKDVAYDLKRIKNKRQAIRNRVNPNIGKYILNCSKEN